MRAAGLHVAEPHKTLRLPRNKIIYFRVKRQPGPGAQLTPRQEETWIRKTTGLGPGHYGIGDVRDQNC